MKFTTLERVGHKLRLLDQTKLPLETVYIDYDDYREIIVAIRQLKVRGAPAIGIAAAYALAVAVRQAHRLDDAYIQQVAGEIKAARPTAVNLSWAIDRALARLAKERPSTVEETLSLLWTEAESIHEEDRRLCVEIGKHGATLIKDGDRILTHCNAGALATGGIGTALGVIYTCRDQGKRISVYANETRPLLQGARLTAWELTQEGIDVTLVCDNVAGMLMRQKRIDHVIVGADRIAHNGDFANKIGTYTLAVLAREHQVPFYTAAPYSTFDDSIASGNEIPIEERSPVEVTEGFGCRTAPVGVLVYSPAFDITPRELVTYYITDQGLKPGGRNPLPDPI
ncbi:MAG TPA: S-methyl-5-thioribose-1-phosphate isomerase [Candidatus Deferrimicrobium sp.]|nr:S-methyl-5-thioribose-1-phosphate isomerase [Candidatus Deferrimicrobium sp.]